MYLRMLKKDLKDKLGLNIVLCIFMIIAATLLVMSVEFFYSLIGGIEKTYEKCNTSDVIFTVDQSVSDKEGQRKKIDELIRSDPLIGEVEISERILLRTSRLEFEGVDRRRIGGLYENVVIISPVSRSQNIPYDINDSQFTLNDGCVALPQYIANSTGNKVGDSLRLTTDLGNIYEFTISHIYKDPSTSAIHKILFSDNDHEALKKEFFGMTDLYEIKLTQPFKDFASLQDWGWDLEIRLQELAIKGEIPAMPQNINTGKTNVTTEEALVSLIIGIFMVIMGVALIVLIFMSIRFSLQATIKREQREIGTMKAIGVDSLSYRTLFIVKYIAFAMLGGVIGSIAGTALCRFMIRYFISNTLNPDNSVLIMIGVLCSVFFILMMILFSFIALRKMRKISVMDTIHGENRGERFHKLPGVFLHKSKKISVPLFLAGCDITGRLKRYLYLIVSYTMGMVVILMAVQLKATVVSDDYRRTYMQFGDRELIIRPEDEIRDRIIEQEGSYRNAFLYYEKYYNEHGIPLNTQITDEQEVALLSGDKRDGAVLHFGDYDIGKLKLVKGSKTPKLPNEVVISHLFKKLRGVDIGDTITLEMKIYEDDGFTIRTVQREFIVTGYVESTNYNKVFMTGNNDDIVSDDWSVFNQGIDAEDSEYHEYIDKMRAVNKDILIQDFDEVLDYDLGRQYGTLFDALIITMGIIMTVTCFAMTFLYQQIFMEDETADIAMLKSLGIDKKSIRAWHYERLLILVGVAAAAAVIMALTVNRFIFDRIGVAVLHVAEFIIASPTAVSLIALPLWIALLISAVMMISFKTMDKIQIWRVRDE